MENRIHVMVLDLPLPTVAMGIAPSLAEGAYRTYCGQLW